MFICIQYTVSFLWFLINSECFHFKCLKYQHISIHFISLSSRYNFTPIQILTCSVTCSSSIFVTKTLLYSMEICCQLQMKVLIQKVTEAGLVSLYILIHQNQLLSQNKSHYTDGEINILTSTTLTWLGLVLEISSLRMCVSHRRYHIQISDTRYQIPDIRYQISDTRFQIISFPVHIWCPFVWVFCNTLFTYSVLLRRVWHIAQTSLCQT